MRVGIIGTGWGVRVQVPAFRSAGLTVAGIAGHNQDKTAKIAAELETQPFADWQALIASDIELVSIVTPPSLHREMAIAALKAGNHVLCEKPTALDASQAEEMAAVASAHPDQLALIDHELRFFPLLLQARTSIRSGKIGSVRHITSTITSSGRANRTQPWTWWSDAAQGGGTWGAIGSHQIDTLRYLCGEITSVSADLRTFVGERPSDTGPRQVTSDDYATARFTLHNGASAVCVLSTVAARNEPDQMTIHGTEGALRITSSGLELAALNGEWELQPFVPSVAIPQGISGLFPLSTVYLAHALVAWANGDAAALDPAATFADGLRNQQILDAGRRSNAQDGAKVSV